MYLVTSRTKRDQLILIECGVATRRDCSRSTLATLASTRKTEISNRYLQNMTEYIIGFIVALVLAAFLVIWFAYCMFVRERHKNNVQYNISDIIKRNQALAELEASEEKCEKKSGLAAGIFILPSRHKQKDDYDKRPDYPESPVHIQLSTEKLVELFNDNDKDDDFYKDGTLEIGSNATYISDV